MYRKITPALAVACFPLGAAQAHASVFGDGNGTYDYYSFSLTQAATVILDIDNGMDDLDSEIGLWTMSGAYLTENDDFWPPETVGAGGSTQGYDSFIQPRWTREPTW